MKALAIHPHFAALVASSAKSIEGRKWSTRYRGPLAIYASRSWGPGGFREVEDYLLSEDCPSRLWVELCVAHRPDEIPMCGERPASWGWEEYVERDAFARGAIVAVAELVDVVKVSSLPDDVYRDQTELCDFNWATHAWMLERVVRLPEPVVVPTRGPDGEKRNFQGLWRVPPDVEARLDEYLEAAAA